MLSLVVLNCLAVGETTGVCRVANVNIYFTVWLSFAPLVILPDNSKFSRFLFENVVSHYAVSSPTFPVNMSFLGPVLLHTGRHSGAWLSYRRPHMYLSNSALPSKRGRSWLIFGRYPIRISVVTLITLGNDCGFFYSSLSTEIPGHSLILHNQILSASSFMNHALIRHFYSK